MPKDGLRKPNEEFKECSQITNKHQMIKEELLTKKGEKLMNSDVNLKNKGILWTSLDKVDRTQFKTSDLLRVKKLRVELVDNLINV